MLDDPSSYAIVRICFERETSERYLEEITIVAFAVSLGLDSIGFPRNSLLYVDNDSVSATILVTE